MSLDYQISIIKHEVAHLKFRAAHPGLTRFLGEGSMVEEVAVSWSDQRGPAGVSVQERIQSLENRITAQGTNLQGNTGHCQVHCRTSGGRPVIPLNGQLLETLNLSQVNAETLAPSAPGQQSLSNLSRLLSGDTALLETFDGRLGSSRDAATRAFAVLAEEDTLRLAAVRQAATLTSRWAGLSLEGRQAALGQSVKNDLLPLLGELTALAGLAGYETVGERGQPGFSSAFIDASIQIYADRMIQVLANMGSGVRVGFFDFASVSVQDKNAQNTAVALGNWLDQVPTVKGTEKRTLEIFVENAAGLTEEKLKEALSPLLALEPGKTSARMAALGRVNLHLLTPEMPNMPTLTDGRYALDAFVDFIAARDLKGQLPLPVPGLHPPTRLLPAIIAALPRHDPSPENPRQRGHSRHH